MGHHSPPSMVDRETLQFFPLQILRNRQGAKAIHMKSICFCIGSGLYWFTPYVPGYQELSLVTAASEIPRRDHMEKIKQHFCLSRGGLCFLPTPPVTTSPPTQILGQRLQGLEKGRWCGTGDWTHLPCQEELICMWGVPSVHRSLGGSRPKNLFANSLFLKKISGQDRCKACGAPCLAHLIKDGWDGSEEVLKKRELGNKQAGKVQKLHPVSTGQFILYKHCKEEDNIK